MSDKSVVNCTVIVEEFIVNIYSSPIFFELEIKLCLKSIISLSNNLFNNPAFLRILDGPKINQQICFKLKKYSIKCHKLLFSEGNINEFQL